MAAIHRRGSGRPPDGRDAAGAPARAAGPRRGAGHGHGRCCGGRKRGGVGRGALVEPAALAALLRREGHGYDLRRLISELSGGEIEVDFGGLYRVLRRLEEEGFVVSSLAESEAGPQRREYSLTPEGRELAEDWVWHLRERQELAALLAETLEQELSGTSIGNA